MEAVSSEAVGSSSTNTAGRMAKADAKMTACFWPPESSSMLRSSSGRMPSAAAASSTRSTISARGSPRFSQPKAISEATSRFTNWLRGFWNTDPTRTPSSSGAHAATSVPPTSTRPVTSPAYTWGTRPFTRRESVVFQQPEGPVTTTHWPAGTSRLTERSVGSAAPG